MRNFWIAALAIFVLDQASKAFVLYVLDLQTRLSLDVLPPFLNLRMAWNDGVNFGLLGGLDMRWPLVGLALVISIWVTIWVRNKSSWAKLAAGLLVGGAIGNVIDRVIYGAVADFLNMSCCGIDNPFAFNVADVAIFAGAVGLIFIADSKES